MGRRRKSGAGRAPNFRDAYYKLGRDFQEEHRGEADNSGWNRHSLTFDQFCQAVLGLRDAIQNPPGDFAPLAIPLMEAARIAKGIRGTLAREGSDMAYLDFFPELNAVSLAGWEAVNQATKARRVDDPFAFVDATLKGGAAEQSSGNVYLQGGDGGSNGDGGPLIIRAGDGGSGGDGGSISIRAADAVGQATKGSDSHHSSPVSRGTAKLWFIDHARDGLNEGYRVIAHHLNQVLREKAPGVLIESAPMRQRREGF